jgi:hypothetical protein
MYLGIEQMFFLIAARFLSSFSSYYIIYTRRLLKGQTAVSFKHSVFKSGLPDIKFHTKVPIWVYIFCSALEWKMLVYFMTISNILQHLVYYMAIWYIIWPFGILYGHLVYYMAIWYIWCSFGIFYPHVVPRKIWQPCF